MLTQTLSPNPVSRSSIILDNTMQFATIVLALLLISLVLYIYLKRRTLVKRDNTNEDMRNGDPSHSDGNYRSGSSHLKNSDRYKDFFGDNYTNDKDVISDVVDRNEIRYHQEGPTKTADTNYDSTPIDTGVNSYEGSNSYTNFFENS